MNSLQDNSLTSILPDSLKVDSFIVALAEAAETELKEAYREAEVMSNLSDVDNIPEVLLDFLAYQKHVDFYENTFPIEQKRELVKNATMWHRKKGTPWAIEFIVSLFFNKAITIEWFDYDANPFHFSVEIYQKKFKSEDIKKLKEMIQIAKNARSWFDGFTLVLFDYVIYQIDMTYHYPVYYPETGEFSGKKNFSQLDTGNVDIVGNTYNFDVEYPVSEKSVSVINGESAELNNDTYNYAKVFREAGVMETLSKRVETQVSSVSSYQDSYGYDKNYQICGEFVAGGEW